MLMQLLTRRVLSSESWADVSENLRKSLQRQALVAVDATWMYVYLGALLLSFVSTMMAGYHMRKLGGDMFRSAVRFVIATFLFFSSLKALVASILFTALSIELQDYLDMLADLANEYRNETDSGSIDAGDVIVLLKSAAESDNKEAQLLMDLISAAKPLSNTLTSLLLADNVLFVLSAYWILLVAHELFKLAMATLDRGKEHERRTIWKYIIGAVVLFMAYFAWSLPIVISHSGYTRSLSFLCNVETWFIISSVLYSNVALIILRCSGRKDEHIHGRVVLSPLYQRLKNLMIVCAMFTLPYAVLQMCLLNMSTQRVDNISNTLVGLVTTLYYLFGAAQGLVMGGSQQCCMRLLEPVTPAAVKQSPEWKRMRSLRRVDSMIGNEYTTAPEKPIFVYTDIESSSALWAQAPADAIEEAQDLHDDLLRYALPVFHGYEVTTVGDAFQLAFHTIEDAVGYCIEVQLRLLHAKWPSEIEGIVPSTKTEWVLDGIKPELVFKGVRVRMGVHDSNVEKEGSLVMQVHPVTGKGVYIGASEMIAQEVGDVGFGGQIIVSERVAQWLQHNESKIQAPFLLHYYDMCTVKTLDLGVDLYEVTPKNIAGRRKMFQRRLGIETSPIEIVVTEEYDGHVECTTNDLQEYYQSQRTPTSHAE